MANSVSSNEVCEGCHKPRPNVGKWEDGRRLCGVCKVKIWQDNGGADKLVKQLEAELKNEPGCED